MNVLTNARRMVWMVALALAPMLACAGDTGPAGPAGPTGADGMDGTNGTNGIAGTDGTDGIAGMNGSNAQPRLLDERLGGWLGDVRTALDTMVQAHGNTSDTYDPSQPPIAVFDWDNTVIKNDIGDQTFFYMVGHDVILQPTGLDWSTTSDWLTTGARAALNAACDSLASPGEPLPTSTTAGAACADTILSIYGNGTTPSGDAAWTDSDTTTYNASYAWVPQLLAGYTPSDVREIARAAFDRAVWTPVGAADRVIGTTSVTSWLRVYDQMRDLIEVLEQAGFVVWIVTASPQFVVDGISEQAVGVPGSRVIGIRSVVVDGVITADFEGCGTVASGEQTLITYDEGKRCWINKVIFQRSPDQQLVRQTDASLRPVFVAGDSDTDIAMLKDATALRLVINRNKTQAMCNAYADTSGTWVVQPMFIEPKSCRTTPYSCTTATDHDGETIVDADGTAFTMDYDDAVCMLE